MEINEIFEGRSVPKIFRKRLETHFDELKWLYFELYSGREDRFLDLCLNMASFYQKRGKDLKTLDLQREEDPDWYKGNDFLGMMLYTDAFAGNLKGVEQHLDYLEKCQVNYVHLMPLLDITEGKSDGGYAVSDYRRVQKKLGTMTDLKKLAKSCHDRRMCVCLDYVMNHTSEDHEWARRARAGEKEYKDRYYFYDNYEIPAEFEKTVPQVFPTTAPGNFTYLEDLHQFVMTTFYPYQWDLNYWNPVVFNEMVYNMLYLANQGIDILRIDAVPYIWKELGTDCRNRPRVHTVVRMIRMICEIVCPGVLLLGEVVMEPSKLAPYFGTVEKPECHMLYNVTTMATLWHTVATRDTRLLRDQLSKLDQLPKEHIFLNYLRCHDDIGWGLDFSYLEQFAVEEIPHKRFLNDYFLGKLEHSRSTGELYNDDPVTMDARFCGTTASMCGIERAGFEQDEEKTELAVRLDLMLHAFLLFQSGIPVLYSGDEVGQINDWDYKKDPLKAPDSRYLHRGSFKWELTEAIDKKGTVPGQIFHGIGELERLRKKHPVFTTRASVCNIDTGNHAVLGIRRLDEKEQVTGLYNFSDQEQTIDLGKKVILKPYEYRWLFEKINSKTNAKIKAKVKD